MSVENRKYVMTDLPRFQIDNCCPEQCYRQYHGAALVAWVISAADWWLRCRSGRRFAVGALAPQSTSDQPYPSLLKSTS